MKSAVLKATTTLLGAALLAGCGLSMREHRGYVMDEQLTQAVQVGVDNKQSVQKTLGQPTFTGQFSESDWYYLSRETRAFAFRNPRGVDQSVLHIRFDPAGNVASVEHLDERLVASINPVNDQTPTLGRKRGFFEELLGGIGTIQQPGLPGSNPRGQ
jgi:outer membrane protein assembly factor BamE (lipoprotein component of BamABCDE complex)